MKIMLSFSFCLSFLFWHSLNAVTIITSDGKEFIYTNKTEIAALYQCKTIEDFFSNFEDQEAMPLQVSSPCWQKIDNCLKLLYKAQHLAGENQQNLKEIDMFLSQLNADAFYEFIYGCNYVDNEDLMNIALDRWLIDHEIPLEETNPEKYTLPNQLKKILQQKLENYVKELFLNDSQRLLSCSKPRIPIHKLYLSFVPITAIAKIDENDQRLLIGFADGTIISFDLLSGKKLYSLSTPHEGEVTKILATPDYMISVSYEDLTACVFNINTGEHLYTYTFDFNLRLACIDNTVFFSSFNNGSTTIIDLKSTKPEKEIPHALIQGIALDDDATLLSSFSSDGTIHIWDVESSACLHTFHHPGINDIALSSCGKYLMSVSENNLVVWDVAEQRCMYNLKTPGIRNSGWIENEKYIVATFRDKTYKIWNTQTGDLVLTDTFNNKLLINGKELVIYDQGNNVLVRDISTGKVLLTLKGHAKKIKDIVYNTHYSSLLTASNDGSVRIWDIKTGICSHVLNYSGPLKYLWILNNGRNIATITNNDAFDLTVWDFMESIEDLISKSSQKQRRLLALGYKKKYNNEILNVAHNNHLNQLFNAYKKKHQVFIQELLPLELGISQKVVLQAYQERFKISFAVGVSLFGYAAAKLLR